MAATACAAIIWASYAFFIGRVGGQAFEHRPWIGLLLAFVTSRLVAAMLFGVTTTDLGTYAGVIVIAIPLRRSPRRFRRSAPPAWTRWWPSGPNSVFVCSLQPPRYVGSKW